MEGREDRGDDKGEETLGKLIPPADVGELGDIRLEDEDDDDSSELFSDEVESRGGRRTPLLSSGCSEAEKAGGRCGVSNGGEGGVVSIMEDLAACWRPDSIGEVNAEAAVVEDVHEDDLSRCCCNSNWCAACCARRAG